jgi:hypothetical protein
VGRGRDWVFGGPMSRVRDRDFCLLCVVGTVRASVAKFCACLLWLVAESFGFVRDWELSCQFRVGSWQC